jgi:metallo-beta-lactamase class B
LRALAACVCLAAGIAMAQDPPEEWRRPFAAHRVVGNVYYVGTYDLACFLITTPQGHALINTGLRDSAPLIRKSVTDLGFKFEDIRWLLTTQAHYDHVAALAEVQKLTGAKVLATAPDAAVLEDGGKSDFHWGAAYNYAPAKVSERIADGQTLNLGGVELTVHLHPGHTRGSASYALTVKEGGRDYRVLIANIGTINNGVRLTANTKYPAIADDYAKTFASQNKLPCDVFLASHASQYRLHEKYTPGMPYQPDRFVDPEGYRRTVAASEAAYRRQLAAERGDDRSRIEELHRIDRIATMGPDVDVLLGLLDEEVVSLMPGSAPVVGKDAVRQYMTQLSGSAREFETVEYRQEWKDLRIEGDYAFEWGVFHSKLRRRKDGKLSEQSNQVMRVLKRQPDGFWKVFRTIMN